MKFTSIKIMTHTRSDAPVRRYHINGDARDHIRDLLVFMKEDTVAATGIAEETETETARRVTGTETTETDATRVAVQ